MKTDAWDRERPSEPNAYNWKLRPQLERAALPSSSTAPGIIDLFSGCGGISVGFRAAGFQTVLAVDIHQPSVDTFRLNHPEATTILGDINHVSDDMLNEALADQTPTVVVGGAPCQGFSLCNRKQFDGDPRNMLFKQYMRIVRLVQPRFVLFENVSNLRSVADGKFARLIAEHFEEIGYSVASGVVSATDFGVPQRRLRLIFLGIRGRDKTVPWPIGDRAGRPPLTVYDAIGDLPELGNDDRVTEYSREPDRPFQKEMRHGATQLLNHESPRHPRETVRRIARTRPGEPMYASFRQRIRLAWDAPSPTQVSGGIRPQFQFGHPSQARGLSVRERCRIQSFPDSFEVLGGIVQGRVQTGNAVPPNVAEAFGRVVMSLLTGEKRIDMRRTSHQLTLQLAAAG